MTTAIRAYIEKYKAHRKDIKGTLDEGLEQIIGTVGGAMLGSAAIGVMFLTGLAFAMPTLSTLLLTMGGLLIGGGVLGFAGGAIVPAAVRAIGEQDACSPCAKIPTPAPSKSGFRMESIRRLFSQATAKNTQQHSEIVAEIKLGQPSPKV